MHRNNLPLCTLFLTLSLLTACGDDDASELEPSVEQQQLAERCARVTACFELEDSTGVTGLGGLGGLGHPDNPEFGRCYRLLTLGLGPGLNLNGPSEEMLTCLDNATNCDAVGACLNGGSPTEPCDPEQYATHCVGDFVSSCTAGILAARDCAAEGLQCIDLEGTAECGLPETCEPSLRLNSCEADTGRILTCSQDMTRVTQCRSGRCIEADDVAHCAGSGDPCDQQDARCDGNTAVNCIFGFEQRFECAGGCEITTDGPLCLPGDQCTRNRCDGDTLITCLSGLEHPVDCKAQGFNTCVEDPEPGCVP